MHIHFERTGGFAGLRLIATVHTESLSPEEARELHEMVDAAGFFDLPAALTTARPGADRFQYRLTVESGARQHTIETNDGSAPQALQPLLRRLTAIARSPSAS